MRFKPNYAATKEAIIDSRNIYNCIMLPLVYTKIRDLDYEVLCSKEPITFSKMKKMKFKKLAKNKPFGKELFDCAWFHVTGTCDVNIDEAYLAFDINGEALLVDKNGAPVKGFTNKSSVFDRALGEPGKTYYPLKGLVEDNKIDLYFDCGYNDLFGNIQNDGKVEYISLVKKDFVMEKICYDFDFLLKLLKIMEFKNNYFDTLYNGVIAIRDLFWFDVKDKEEKALKIISDLFSVKTKNIEKLPTFYGVGHAHLDLAWLWPIRESKRKIVRTMTNVYYLIEKYNNFHYVISQPQQIEWLKEQSPLMFEKLKSYEKSGRIELVGGAFVEFDTNVSGEEQLARQMLYGQKYYLENFGHYVNNLWLPDTFGYNGNLPQLIKQGGMKYFMTIKTARNRFSDFPYHHFIWEGIDKSKVIAHIPPEGTYNSEASPKSIYDAMSHVSKSEMKYDSLMIYGIGDGGGGPGEEHVEKLHRLNGTLGLNKVESNKSVDSYFVNLEKHKESLPIYKGEIYLENHCGTYTSQSLNKQYDRYISEKIKRLEYILSAKGINRFEDEINELYRRVLLLEFHDILPGSSIKRVYEESKIEYENIDKKLNQIFKKAIKTYCCDYKPGYYLYNHLSYKANKLIKYNDSYYLFNLNPNSWTNDYKEYSNKEIYNSNIINTNLFEIKFNQLGYIDEIIYKKTNKNILLNNGNKLIVLRDHGDAWTFKENYRNQDEVLMKLTEREIYKYDNLYEVISKYSFKESTVVETIIIDDSNLIRFKHEVDWHNVGYMLKSNFDLSIKTNKAVCDIQFGKINRSRKNDTLVHKAQYEICAQQYVDINDKKVGVALINKAKNGYYVKDNNLELTLLRSTNYPCKEGDYGHHTYEYALYIHDGDDNKAKVDKVAYIFNSDFVMSSKEIMLKNPLILNNELIEYSCYKKKYKDDGLIVRLYERNGKNVKLDLTKTSLKNKHLTLVNFLEEPLSEQIDGDILEFKPFEVKTIWFH